MYRFNADGSIEQIGRSGVKQAFLTVNVGCLDPSDHNSHVARPRLRRHLLAPATTTTPRVMSPRSEMRAGDRHLGPLRLDLRSRLQR